EGMIIMSNIIKKRAQVVLGPTMSHTQNALMQYEAGTTAVEELQQQLHSKVEKAAKALPPEVLDKAVQFTDEVEAYCYQLSQRGIKVNEERFNSEIDKASQAAKEVGNDRLYMKLDGIRRNLNEVTDSKGVVYPKL